ncbi:MAG: dihydrofolate reductase family protein [Fimbriimonas sp.]|nr:dihydrofolate reductase family protein [Fimbriimonas sp.]
MTIRVAHDFNCPWCWVGLFHAQRLEREFGVTIEWVGYELFPKEMEWDYSSCPIEPKNKPKTPGRFAIHAFAEGIPVPNVDRPFEQRTYNSHQAVEYAKTEGVSNQLVERLYRAHWEEGKDINAIDVLEREAAGLVQNVSEMLKAVEDNRFDDKVVDFDQPAFDSGVYNLPTFFIGEERLAEQPYRKIKAAMEKLIPPDPAGLVYQDLVFANWHADRPFTFINMVTTIDGKIITGERGEPVTDLGSANDHKIMRRLEQKADAILSGGTSVRASGNWNPETVIRIAVTRSGDLPYDRPFFTQGKPIVMYPEGSTPSIPENIKSIAFKDWPGALRRLKQEGVEIINVLGGSDINAQLLQAELVDELFLTLAPKIKLGDQVPTYAGGNPLPREMVQTYKLEETHQIGDELFLRYTKPK